MGIGYRLGQFFFFLGLGLLILFWGSLQNPDTPALVDFMLVGGVSVLLGVWLLWRNRSRNNEAERFRMVRKLTSGRKKEKEKSAPKD